MARLSVAAIAAAAVVVLVACSSSGEGARFPANARLDEPWPHACAGTEGEIDQTRCPEGQTCCKSQFSQSKAGCCPWDDAVCCPVSDETRGKGH